MVNKNDYHSAWRKKNTLRCEFYVNANSNKEIYEHLSKQTNKRAYLLKLIEEDIKRGKKV